MLNVLFNRRYDPDDEELIDLISMNSQIVSSFGPNDPINWIKWLRYIYQTESYLRLKDALAKRDKYISRYLREHLKTYKEGLKRDFTDYLIELSRQKNSASVATDSDLEMILSDMIIAGSETTLTSLQWMIVCLIRWPEYQDKLFHDIINNIDTGRYPCIKNKLQFHFVQAFIHEVLRFVSFVPICPPHKTIEDENIAAHNIPKGTIVFYNIWAIHHQEDVFPNSEKFNPDRWLDRNGHFQNSKSFMIFSVGKRACLGENLARKEMFLFLTRLVRDFEIQSEPHTPLPDFEGITGGTIFPKPFNAVFQSRPF